MNGSVIQMAPGFFFFRRGWLNGNHFAFTGARTILIDSAYLGGRKETFRLLASAGVAPEQADLLLTTHVHCDHVGAHAAIARRSGCKVALSRHCRSVIDQRDARATWHGFYGQRYEFFPTHQSLEHGQRLDLNGLEFICLHAPGHAEGQLCFFAPDAGWLISADAVWDADFGVLTTQVEGRDAPRRQRESLLMLAKLKPGRIFPGHGPVMDDGPAAIEACLERVAAFIEQPVRVGRDQLRKILLFQVMMHQPLEREALWRIIRDQPWYVETHADYFAGEKPETLFRRNLDGLLERGLLLEAQGRIISAVPP